MMTDCTYEMALEYKLNSQVAALVDELNETRRRLKRAEMLRSQAVEQCERMRKRALDAEHAHDEASEQLRDGHVELEWWKSQRTTSIAQWQRNIHTLASEKGWWDDRNTSDPHHIASALCLIHSEVSEALEDVRNGDFHVSSNAGKPCGFPVELADIVIRCLDLADAMGIDLGSVIHEKHAYNFTRPHRHGGKKL